MTHHPGRRPTGKSNVVRWSVLQQLRNVGVSVEQFDPREVLRTVHCHLGKYIKKKRFRIGFQWFFQKILNVNSVGKMLFVHKTSKMSKIS